MLRVMPVEKPDAEPLFDGLRYLRPAQEDRIVFEAGARHTGHALPLLLCTGFALIFVLAIAYALIQAAGARTSPSGLIALAGWAEIAFAAVAAIEICRIAIPPLLRRTTWGWSRQLLVLLAAIPVVVGLIAVAEGRMLSAALTQRQARYGRTAVHLYITARAALDGDGKTVLPGLSPSVLRQADGRTFLGLAPLAVRDADGGGAGQGDEAGAALRMLTSRHIGTAAQVYDDVFVPSVRNLRDAYNSYAALQADLVAAIRAIPARQENAWNVYESSLRAHDLNPARIPPADRPLAIELARAAGINVPDDWIPADKSDFAAIAFRQFREDADAQYKEQIKRVLGIDLAPGLDFRAFSAQDAIQARWRSGISAPPDVVLAPDMGLEAFDRLVYEPELNQIMRPQLDVLNAPAADFAPGRRFAEQGREALVWALVPCLGLVGAFLCCFWLAYRIVTLALRLAVRSPPARLRLNVAAAVLIAALALGLRSEVTNAAAYTRFENTLATRYGPGWLLGRAMIQTAPIVSQAGSAVADFVFGDFDFGLSRDPATETALDTLVQ